MNTLVCGGTVFLRVSRQSGNTQAPIAYTVTVSLDASDPYECNNSFAEAALIPADTTFQAKLYGINLTMPDVPAQDAWYNEQFDRDFYKVATGTCDTLRVHTTGGPPDGRIALTVYNSSFQMIHGHTYAGQPGFPDSILVVNTGDTTYIVVTEKGMYQSGDPVLSRVPYTITVGCSDFTTSIVHQNNSQVIHVFPNPTTGTVTIDANKALKPNDLTLFDATGRSVLERSIANEGATFSLDLSDQETGIYFVHVLFTNGTKQVQRLVKQ